MQGGIGIVRSRESAYDVRYDVLTGNGGIVILQLAVSAEGFIRHGLLYIFRNTKKYSGTMSHRVAYWYYPEHALRKESRNSRLQESTRYGEMASVLYNKNCKSVKEKAVRNSHQLKADQGVLCDTDKGSGL